MHAVLYLQAVGFGAQQHQALEQRLAQPRPRCRLVHHHRPQLAVVPHQHHLLCAHDQGNKGLRLSGLCGLVQENLPEPEVGQPRVPTAHTGGTHYVCRAQHQLLNSALQAAELGAISGGQLPLVVHQLLQPPQLRPLLHHGAQLHVPHLVVQRQLLTGRCNVLPGARRDTHHLEPCRVQLLRKVVHCNVTGCRHQHLPTAGLDELVHDGCAGDCLSRSWRPLYE
mmetsp:Transcript_611/g.1769  ORF Transcript_611/g.1769 Transcript_611/m.1769 type:complete len:224 (+) Transcript_611:3387-4058(+)